MRKLLFLLGAVSIAAVHGCSTETGRPSGASTIVMETVSEASFDDRNGIYKAVLTNGESSVTINLGTQPGGVAMEVPTPCTGNYSISSSDKSYSLLEGNWTDAGGSYKISGGTVSAVAGDGTATISGSVKDGMGNSFRFKAEGVQFTHSVEEMMAFGSCRSSYADGLFSLSMESGNIECDIVIPAAESGADVEIPAGSFSISDGTIKSAVWNDGENEISISDMTLCVSGNSGSYTISGVVSAAALQGTRIIYEGPVSSDSEAGGEVSDLICGSWSWDVDSLCVYDKSSDQWEVVSVKDEQYGADLIGLEDKSYMMMKGIFEEDFNVLGRISEGSLLVDANPESNPVAYITTADANYWLFLTLFDPDTGRLMMWDPVEFKISEDFNSISTVQISREFTDGQTGQKMHADYRYLGIIGYDKDKGRVTMFENWPLVKLPVFVRPGSTASAAECKTVVSGPEPLMVSGTITDDEIISITPLNK